MTDITELTQEVARESGSILIIVAARMARREFFTPLHALCESGKRAVSTRALCDAVERAEERMVSQVPKIVDGHDRMTKKLIEAESRNAELVEALEKAQQQIIALQQRHEIDPRTHEIIDLKERINQLESRTVMLPPELYTIGELIRTQDNRITDQPMFVVFQKREIIGSDEHSPNCAITRCYIENFGRLAPNPGTAGIWERPLGASGIGIGTGALDDEPLFMGFNTVKTGANFPMFLEPQGGGAARGAIALGNILMGGYAGLADCGVDGFQAIANQIRLNKFGILRYPGTNNDGKPGRRAQFISNIVDSNEEHGVYSYSTKTDPLIGWNMYAHNQIINNGKDGMNFRYTSPDVVMQNETIDNNHIVGNGRHGVNVEAAKAVINCDITNNKVWGNGQKEAGNGVNSTSAIPFTACSINNNKIRDTQTVPTQQYPVSLTGVLTDVDISVNHCVGNVNNTINTPNAANQRVTKNINSGAL
ncbi:hypothetical protein [Klebsiella aerogenes]|uniref:hypothetical protein n=1 Tax=Klebsiella aerogenes TaxID=548 RepID=UPI001E4EFF74|nr:hypothetical protein [Klebsiella aerogenes]